MRMMGMIAIASLLSGCATEGMSIPLGVAKNLPPTDPAKIVLLLSPPPQAHEIIALVEGVAATDDYLGERRTQDAAVAAMKKEAARLGADAIVLTGQGREPYTTVVIGSGTAVAPAGSSSAIFNTTATGMGFQKIRVSGSAVHFTEK